MIVCDDGRGGLCVLGEATLSRRHTDFAEERRILLENVGPDLQAHYDSTGLEVELVDMHYGTEKDPLTDPLMYWDHLAEIKACHKISRGCFFLCLVGEETTGSPLPAELTEEEHARLLRRAKDLGLDTESVAAVYRPVPGHGYRITRGGCDEATERQALESLRTAAEDLASESQGCQAQLTRTAVEHQFAVAADLSPDLMVAILRDFEGREEPQRIKRLKQEAAAKLPEENLIKLSVAWRGEGKINPDLGEHDTYLTIFQETLTSKLQDMINKSIEEKPEINARNKTIQEVFKEALIHLAMCRQIQEEAGEEVPRPADEVRPVVETVRQLMSSVAPRHGPVILHGAHGSGKTSVLTEIYSECENWFGKKVLRVLRFSGLTPRSSYNLELVRIICEQLCLLLQPSQPCIPKDASFDPLYVNNWFQTLVRRFDEESPEGAEDKTLVILIDDIHRLNPLDSDIVAALSWLPINLPKNVHIVVTTVLPPDVLKTTPVQKERFRSAECLIQLPSPQGNIEKQIEDELEKVETELGCEAMRRGCGMLSAAEFGLSEVEMLELLMPTSIDNGPLLLSNGVFNFATFCSFRRKMAGLIIEKFMSGRILLCWKHELTSKVAKNKYFDSQDSLKSFHNEIANLFFSEFSNHDDDEESEHLSDEEKQTPFQSTLHVSDVTYSLRHVEESWIHLLKAGDSNRLKELTFCNFDFLLAAVRTISVSYLRSILEHVRCYLLDRDIELVYYTVRKSSDVLTRDTLQLGAQVISWLRPVADTSGELMSRMIMSAMAWCDGFTDPLLVPLNSWLQPPLPLQIKTIICSSGVRIIEPTPSAQHVVVVPPSGDPQLWHVMSNSLIHTFRGHNGQVLCMAVPKQGPQFLITGSEDTSTIVWDLNTYEIKYRFHEHIAPVLCVTPALNNSLVASGGEDSRIIISCLRTGAVKVKIDHHRGPVTAIQTTQGDILISGSSDKSVCLWELESYTLLNTITMNSPVSLLSVTDDSVFLLIKCDDNQLYLHTLATGTEIHTLRGHKAKVGKSSSSDKSVCLWELESCTLLNTITMNSPVSLLSVTDDSVFLLIKCDDNQLYLHTLATGTEIHTLRGHKAKVGKSSSSDKSVCLWELESCTLLNTITMNSPVSLLSVTDDSVFLLIKCDDNQLYLHTLATGTEIHTLRGHKAKVGKSSSSDKSVCLWELESCTLLNTITMNSPVSLLSVTDDSVFLLIKCDDNQLYLHTLATGTEIHTLRGHKAKVGKSSSSDKSVCLWELESCTLLNTITMNSPVSLLSVTDDSVFLLIKCDDNQLYLHTLATGTEIHTLRGHKAKVGKSSSSDKSVCLWELESCTLLNTITMNSPVSLLSVTDDSVFLLIKCDDNQLYLHTLATGTEIHTLRGHKAKVGKSSSSDKSVCLWELESCTLLNTITMNSPVSLLSVTDDSVFLLIKCDDNQMYLHTLATGTEIHTLRGHKAKVGKSSSSDKSVCLWELESCTLLNTITMNSPVSLLSVTDDSVFPLIKCDDNQMYLHTLATGTEIHTLRGHKAKVTSMSLAGDNQRAVAGGADGRVYVFDMHSGCLVRTITTSHNAEVTGVKVTNNDDFLITAGGNRITCWSFRKEDGVGVDESAAPMTGRAPDQARRPHSAPISCCDISRDGITAVTGGMDSLVNVWQLNTHELHSTMEGHTGNVTCVAISPNSIFAISGSEDKTAKVWGLTLGLVVSNFKGHQATVTAVSVLSDSRRVVSADRQGVFTVWLADNATLLHSALGPTTYMAISYDMRYVVSGDGDNNLRIWPIASHREEEKYTVSHSEEITCFVLTTDSLHVITGSRDMSLKVWQIAGGKLAQVLVGHTDQVTCVAVAITNKSIVVSGSRDANVIVWDMGTGEDLHLLQGHLGFVTCVKLAGDGSIAVSGSEDKRILVWDTKKGVPLSSLQLHLPIIDFVMSTDATRMAVHLFESKYLPIICLHNTPATFVKMPVYVAPAKEVEDLRPNAPKRPMRRLLKKEVSLDTYTWQRKYGHLTSSIMKSAVDERLRRRFSVSASMEEISKIPHSKDSMGSQGLGPEQAALAQSQHFDQLEALWNKRSPPRSRRMFQSLSKQNSRSSRRDSSDNDDQPSPVEEVADFIGD